MFHIIDEFTPFRPLKRDNYRPIDAFKPARNLTVNFHLTNIDHASASTPSARPISKPYSSV